MASAVGTGSGATLSLNLAPSSWPDGAIVPGDLLIGRVTFQRTTPVTVRAVRLRFKGIVHSQWTTGSGKHRHTHSQTRELCEVKTNLLENGGSVTMTGGLDVYEFQLGIPSGLPPHFQGPHGYVKYTIEAYVDIPNWPDVTALIPLQLASQQIPPESVSAAPLFDKAIVPLSSFCCCGDAGIAELDVAVPSRWFAQGIALLDAHAGIAARTSKDLSRGATLSLVETQVYTAGTSRCSVERVLGSAPVTPEVLPRIPPTSPSAAAAGAPPVHMKPALLRITGANTPSFGAAGTIDVSHRLVLKLPVPWAVPATSRVLVWIYSPHVRLVDFPVGPAPPLWLQGLPVRRAESSGDPVAY